MLDLSDLTASTFLMQSLPLVMVFFVFYVIVIRPGRVSEGRRWASVKALTAGERVTLTTGMLGTFVALHGDPITGSYEIEIAEGVRVMVIEDAIKSVGPVASGTMEEPSDRSILEPGSESLGV